MLERAQFTAKPLNFQRAGSCVCARRACKQSFHGYTLGKVAWFIDVAAQLNSEMISEKLKRDDAQNRHHVF